MATILMSMQYSRMILLLVLFLLTMQLVNGDVTINNTSTFAVSVYDTNTTELIDPLPANDYTSFNLGSPGPDFFVVKQFNASGAAVSNCTVGVVYNQTLYLYGSKSLMYKIINPTSNSTVKTGGGRKCA